MNPEPIDISIASVDPLPEDPKQTTTTSLLSSDIDFITIITRWQPMGYRVVINLPFVNDDINPLFAIKVGPYIPPVYQWREPITLSSSPVTNGSLFSPIYPSPSTLSSTSVAVTCTRYDNPPSLAVAAAAHRFWTGSMKYRLRCVSNFTAQGYVILTTAKGLVGDEVQVYDDSTSTATTLTLATNHRSIPGVDVGAKRWMGNGYVMSDISMFRHNEIQIPYEYPLPFYDTYRNLEETVLRSQGIVAEVNCPDNFILVYARGGITSPTAGAQVVYELEYCPGEDFQFSQEFSFSGTYLEVNNYNTTNLLVSSITPITLPFTYPAYTTTTS